MITVVTGLGRCGSSMMMRMLEAGGMRVVALDRVYYETHAHRGWTKALLDQCEGACVKSLNTPPPPGREYRFIWMARSRKEQAKSTVKWTRAKGKEVSRAQMKNMGGVLLAREQKEMRRLRTYGWSRIQRVTFEGVLAAPLMRAMEVRSFLGVPLDAVAMAAVVVPRPARCLRGMLEEHIETAGFEAARDSWQEADKR